MTPTQTLRETLEEARRFVDAMGFSLGGLNQRNMLNQMLDSAIAALSAREPQGWRPIAEAPKDGTLLRLFAESLIDEDFNPSGSAEGHWCDDVGWQAALWNDGADEFYTAVIYPSHFMTLPEPPK